MNLIRTLIVFVALLSVSSCDMFSKDEKLLAQLKKRNGEEFNIYYVGLGATTEDNIQVRKEKNDSVLWVSDKYDVLMSSRIVNDTTLQLVLSVIGDNKGDTINIHIK